MVDKVKRQDWNSVLNKKVRRNLREKVGLKQRLEVAIWEESVPNRENN